VRLGSGKSGSSLPSQIYDIKAFCYSYPPFRVLAWCRRGKGYKVDDQDGGSIKLKSPEHKEICRYLSDDLLEGV